MSMLPETPGRSVLIGIIHVRGTIVTSDMRLPLKVLYQIFNAMFPDGDYDNLMRLDNSMIERKDRAQVFFVTVHDKTMKVLEMPDFSDAPWMSINVGGAGDIFLSPDHTRPVEVRVICRM